MKVVKKQGAAAWDTALFEAILTLSTVADCRAFFNDLCTPAEMQALVDRWRVVGLLEQGRSYRNIQAETGVSVTTVGRVARFLHSGSGGYVTVREHLRRTPGEQ